MSEGSRRRDRAWPWLALALIVVVGVVLRAIPLLRSGALFSGIEYDDGVYLSSAALLVSGHLPYTEFTLLHPPGIAVLLAPFGALIEHGDARTAVVLGRWLMVLIAALTILLIADLGRRWRGWPTGLLAAALYAVGIGALVADATVLLEPFLNLVCLAALDLWLAGERGRRTALQCLAVGALLMVGLSIKVWAGVYVAVIGGVFLLRGSWRHLAWTVVGGLVAGAALVLPFVLAAPRDFLTQVVAVQAARPADLSQTSAERLTQLFDLGPVGMGGVAAIGVVAAVVVLAMAALVAWRGGTFGAVLAGLLAVMTTMFLLSTSFFDHYPSFLLPVAVLIVAGGSTILLELLAGRAPRPVTVAVSALVLVVLLGIGGVRAVRQAASGPTQADFGAAIAGLVPGDACLTADDPDVDPRGRAIPATARDGAAGRRPVRGAGPAGDGRRHVPVRRDRRDAPQRPQPDCPRRLPRELPVRRDRREDREQLDRRSVGRLRGEPPRHRRLDLRRGADALPAERRGALLTLPHRGAHV